MASNENILFDVLFTFQESPPEADKPMTSHRGIFDLRYQDLAVDDYSCGIDALSQWNEDPVIGGSAVSSTFATLG